MFDNFDLTNADFFEGSGMNSFETGGIFDVYITRDEDDSPDEYAYPPRDSDMERIREAARAYEEDKRNNPEKYHRSE